MKAKYSDKSLLSCFQHWEKKQSRRTWLTQPYPDGRVKDFSWRAVGKQARRMAAHLQSLGLPACSNVGILGNNSAHWIMADLAIWMAGYVSVPLYPTLNAETARYILEHAEIKLLFLGKLDGKLDGWNEISGVLPPELPLIGLPMSPLPDIPQWETLIKRVKPLKQIREPDRDELATIIYTSGSTGRPKGVMHSYGSMMAAGLAVSKLYDLGPEDRMLSHLPLAHVAERAAVESTSLYFGCRIYFAGDPSSFRQDLKRARPTLFFSVPRLWTKFYLAINEKFPERKQKRLFRWPIVSRLAKRKILAELGLNHVRAALTGSAPLPQHIIEWYRGLGLELLEVYGMSENFGISHSTRSGDYRSGHVGPPAPDVQARIAAEGEMEVKSPGQMLGYYKMPAKTADDMAEDGFFKTGDRGEIDQHGRLRITGRVEELFKTGKGKYVAPAPIENLLGQHHRLEASCVTGSGQPQPFALLMLSADSPQSARFDASERAVLTGEFEALLKQVNTRLEDHEKLAYLVVVKDRWSTGNGYLTPTMKIKRNVIEAHYLPNAESWQRSGQAVIWEA